MSNSASGRNPATNSGSDSAVNHRGTAADQYQRTPAPTTSAPVTGRLSNGVVGNGKPGQPDSRSKVRS